MEKRSLKSAQMSMLSITRPDICGTCSAIDRSINDMAQALGNEGVMSVNCVRVSKDSPYVYPQLHGNNGKGISLSGRACSVVCPRREAKWRALRMSPLADQQNHQSSSAKS